MKNVILIITVIVIWSILLIISISEHSANIKKDIADIDIKLELIINNHNNIKDYE